MDKEDNTASNFNHPSPARAPREAICKLRGRGEIGARSGVCVSPYGALPQRRASPSASLLTSAWSACLPSA